MPARGGAGWWCVWVIIAGGRLFARRACWYRAAGRWRFCIETARGHERRPCFSCEEAGHPKYGTSRMEHLSFNISNFAGDSRMPTEVRVYRGLIKSKMYIDFDHSLSLRISRTVFSTCSVRFSGAVDDLLLGRNISVNPNLKIYTTVFRKSCFSECCESLRAAENVFDTFSGYMRSLGAAECWGFVVYARLSRFFLARRVRS